MPSSSAARTLASAVPRVSWKCSAIASSGTRSATASTTPRTWPGMRDADGVADRDLEGAHLDQRASTTSATRAGATRALRTGSRTRSTGTRGRACPSVGGPVADRRVRRRATRRSIWLMLRWLNVSDAAAKIATSARRPHARARGRRRFGTSAVYRTAGSPRDRREDVRRIRHLRHPLRAHERGRPR